jgi:hypothetical protein
VIELRRREILLAPRLAIADGDRAAAVVAVHQVRWIIGVDPEVMVVPMGTATDTRECLAASVDLNGMYSARRRHPCSSDRQMCVW